MKKQRRIVQVAIVFLACVLCSCKGGHYHDKVSRLHSGMSRAGVIAALGKPYGDVNGMLAYYDVGADSILAVQPNEQGDCQWVVLEVPSSGPSAGFTYYKVRESSSGGAPAAIGTTIYRD
jgi:hypothetical protein